MAHGDAGNREGERGPVGRLDPQPGDAPRRRRRFHAAPGGGDVRTYLEGGLLAVVLSVLGRKRQKQRIEDSVARARSVHHEGADDSRPRRWSRAERRSRETALRWRAFWFFLLCAVLGGLAMWGRIYLEHLAS